MRAYRLAKDEVPNFVGADWVPAGLWWVASGSAHADKPGAARCAKALIDGNGSAELWAAIAAKYEFPDALSVMLPVKCAEYLAAWEALPKRTPAKHRDFYRELERRAKQLALELGRLQSDEELAWFGEDELRPLGVSDLLTDDEMYEAELRMCEYNYQLRYLARGAGSGADRSLREEYEDMGWWIADNDKMRGLWLDGDSAGPGIIPSVPEILTRIADVFAFKASNVELKRPHGENAARNYFTRRLIRMFASEIGEISPSIIVRIVSAFFDQSISEGEVQQLRRSMGSSPQEATNG